MLRINYVYAGIGFAAAVVTAASCGGGGDTTGTGASGGSGGSTSSVTTASSTVSTTASTGSGGMDCAPTEGTTFALTKLSFGDGTNGEWKKVGFNIDGKVSTANSTDLCMPAAGGDPSSAYPDGVDGIDNSFGKNLLPVILSEYPTWPPDLNTAIQEGDFNTLLKLYCLPKKGDAPSLVTKLFGGAPLGMPPKFDGTDMWPVAPELLSNPMDPESSTIVFEKSSVIGELFDSGKGQTFILTVPMASKQRSTSIKLTLHSAQVKMTLSKDRKSATGGIVGGVLNTEEFVDEVKKIGWVFDLCDTDTFDDIVTTVRQASDIMTDGTQDPTKTCDGISIGVEFEMKEVLLGDVGMAAMVGMACTDD